MRIEVVEGYTMRLREVFNSVLFETEEGEKLAVCMRDGGFEIGIKDPVAKCENGEEYYTWYSIKDGVLDAQVCENVHVTDPDPARGGSIPEDLGEGSSIKNEI